MSVAGAVQRVTLWVRDADRSLALYRDLLGLPVLEDKLVPGPYIGRMVGYEAAGLRIVHLGSGSDGWVGLYELRDATPAPVDLPSPPAKQLARGQATVVFRATGVEALAERLVAAGYRFLLPPASYIKETGSELFPAGRYVEAIFHDPDGIPVSLIEHQPL
jgi:catechol 2,3-dioxygenase-like lactoylglutathione lyase family enzyme